MTITEIKKTKNAMRYHLYVDDRFFGIFLDETLAKKNVEIIDGKYPGLF